MKKYCLFHNFAKHVVRLAVYADIYIAVADNKRIIRLNEFLLLTVF